VIDLSYAAAYKLGYIGNGSAAVEVEAIVPGAPLRVAQATRPPAGNAAPPPAANAEPLQTVEAPAGLYLQLAAFSAQASAESMRERLARELDWLATRIYVVASGSLYKVQVGPYRSRDDAVDNAERIAQALNFKPFVVVR